MDHHGGYTYLYGIEDVGDAKHMRMTQMVGDDLRAPWRFFDGSGLVT